MYKALDPVALKSLLEQPRRPRLIDVRSAAEVARGRIEGAEHIELAALPQAAAALAPEEPIVFYCLSGARSAQACGYLMQRGFADLYNLEGGIAAWARAGMPVAMEGN
jgi:rhodanese-related sulfurtransferase